MSNFLVLKTEVANSECTFLVDSGAEISVFKPTKLNNNAIINTNQTCSITGIQQHPVQTIGAIDIPLLLTDNCIVNHKFQIIPECLPIPTDGILGRDFLAKFRCIIDYDTWTLTSLINSQLIQIPIQDKLNEDIIVPPRCEVYRMIKLNVPNQDYVLRSAELQTGVFCANSIINPQNPLIKIINTTDNTVKIKQNFTHLVQPLLDYDIFQYDQVTQNNRNERCLAELDLTNSPTCATDKLKELCTRYNDLFALQNDTLTCNNFYKQNINLNDHTPVYIKNYRIPEVHKTEIDNHIQKMLDEQIIQPSTSPYNSPVLLVPKKSTNSEKKWRLVVDFRQLNKKVIADKFPLPRIDDILDQLGRAKYFSTLDLIQVFTKLN